MDREQILAKITEVLEDALGVDDDEVVADATLTGDLGAESIDFLDIVFRLEKAFDIKIGQGELFPENVAQNPDYVQDGKVTPQGLEELKAKMPHANFAKLEADPDVNNVGEIFTVDALVKFVDAKISATTAG